MKQDIHDVVLALHSSGVYPSPTLVSRFLNISYSSFRQHFLESLREAQRELGLTLATSPVLEHILVNIKIEFEGLRAQYSLVPRSISWLQDLEA